MKILMPIIFATTAAIGNAMFAFGQKKSVGIENGLLFVGVSATVAFMLSFIFAPFLGVCNIVDIVKGNWKAIALSGVGLFFTYLGFNLLYSRYGVSQYALYAVISIITTTIIVGIWLLKEPINIYHAAAIFLAVFAVILFSIGQSKA